MGSPAPAPNAFARGSTSAATPPPRRWDRRAILYTSALLLALTALAIALWVRGASFYLLGLGERVDHPDFRVLGPASPVGHGYGIFGTALIFTNLLYLLRRRLARARLGSMRAWLELHVFTGLFGSVLILYHSAFQLRTPIATLTAVSLTLVVISGLVGRYFYGLSPANADGRVEAGLRELERAVGGLGLRAQQQLALLPAPSELSRPSLFGALSLIPTWRREASIRRATVRTVALGAEQELGLTRAQRRVLRKLARRASYAAAADVRAVAGATLLRSWRGLHRFMALLMVLSVSVHIATAWFFGFRWVFGE